MGAGIADPVSAVVNGGWVAVYGMGYVGRVLAAAFLRRGLRVIGVDVDEGKLNDIRLGRVRFLEVGVEEAIAEGLRSGNLKLMSDAVEASRQSRVKVVTVPVLFNLSDKVVRLDAFVDALTSIAEGLGSGDLVVIESSVPPGTTERVAKSVLEAVSGLKAEDEFLLAYSPERIYVGRALRDLEENYPKVVAGVGPKSLDAVARLYSLISRKGVVRLSSTTAAEFEKLAEGVYRDVVIALSNELALAAQALGINYYEVREAANTQPHCHLLLPGPGVGGPCIPSYPYFLMGEVRKAGASMELTRVARLINESMPSVVAGLAHKLVVRHGLRPRDVRVTILGDAFRGDIDDPRLSPTHDVISNLLSKGYGSITVHDPLVTKDDYLSELGIDLTNDLRRALEGSSLVIVCVRHTAYVGLKVSSVVEASGREPLIVDAVNVLRDDIGYGAKGRLLTLGVGGLEKRP